MSCKSSFHGDIAEIPDICVDNFKKRNRKAYFLSHCHTDHTEGLYSEAFITNLKKTNALIYASEISAAIVEFENRDFKPFIRSLKLGSTTITIPGDEENGLCESYLTVKVIPAGHCLGSVMFLFKTATKTVLYTGDFRISPNSVRKYGQLHENGEPIAIDTLYVDTTFQNVLHTNFPKRSESVGYMIEDIQRWLLECDRNRVALHVSAKYGYEYVYNEIWSRLNEHVYVGSRLCELYSKFPDRINGVTDKEKNTRIHLCSNRNERFNHIKCLRESDNFDFLYVHLSAMKWEGYDVEQTGISRTKDRIDVCFATHCSRSELVFFVNYFAPKKVVGFREPYDTKTCTKVYDDAFVPSPKKRQVYKSETQRDKDKKKVDDDLLKEMFGRD